MEKTCPISSPTPKDESMRCYDVLNMLRNVKCVNKPGVDLMHAFVSDLECGWQSGATVLIGGNILTIIALPITIWLIGKLSL